MSFPERRRKEANAYHVLHSAVEGLVDQRSVDRSRLIHVLPWNKEVGTWEPSRIVLHCMRFERGKSKSNWRISTHSQTGNSSTG